MMEAVEQRIGVAPLPLGPDGRQIGGYQTASGYFISAETNERQACWQWISFLSENPVSEANLPARRSVATSDAFAQLVGDEKAAALLFSVESATEPSFFQRFL